MLDGRRVQQPTDCRRCLQDAHQELRETLHDQQVGLANYYSVIGRIYSYPNCKKKLLFRAPFGLFYHAAWFTQPHHKEGFISFLDTIVAMDDVWIVTNWQAIQWVRNPTPLPLLHTFEPFGCNYPVYINLLPLFNRRKLFCSLDSGRWLEKALKERTTHKSSA